MSALFETFPACEPLRPCAIAVRILFLSPYIPSRIRVRPFEWVRSLSRLGHELHLVALSHGDDESAALDDLRRVCRAVELFPLTRRRVLVNLLRAWPRAATPLQLAYSHHPAAERRVADLVATGHFDVVHVEHMRGVAMSSRARGGAPIVFDAVDSISALFAETARHAPSRGARLMGALDLGRSRRFEARAPSAFHRVIVTSEREATAFRDLADPAARGKVVVVGNGVDTEYFRPADRPGDRTVVFTGKLSYHANAAAAARLVERIMPLVWNRRPDVAVVLAGKDPSAALLALGRDPRVRVTGYVADLRQVFVDAAVAVCPLVYGAGIQNKVLEAMACGVPTVMTPAAAGALAGTNGQHHLTCDDDGAFADAIVRLLADEALRRRVGRAGREYVVANHRWDQRAASLVAAYEAARVEFDAAPDTLAGPRRHRRADEPTLGKPHVHWPSGLLRQTGVVPSRNRRDS